eukprot:TRINITY_DN10319_c0_g1_i5.p1 TRINITY_DN10319_c0_g1~~TRINITY_DN10319_c0_g1_i5.p1  ORF type:complete len:150 (-),score=8.29 TRINITY_DN10319_c0_g1_i5:461-910(-)
MRCCIWRVAIQHRPVISAGRFTQSIAQFYKLNCASTAIVGHSPSYAVERGRWPRNRGVEYDNLVAAILLYPTAGRISAVLSQAMGNQQQDIYAHFAHASTAGPFLPYIKLIDTAFRMLASLGLEGNKSRFCGETCGNKLYRVVQRKKCC